MYVNYFEYTKNQIRESLVGTLRIGQKKKKLAHYVIVIV